MVERGANIDIVFRNGLKDYEVLPPPEVWDNMPPVEVKPKHRQAIVFRVAAMVAAVTTLSFFAYRLTLNSPSEPDNSALAQNEIPVSQDAPPAITKPLIVSVSRPVRIASQVKNQVNNTSEILIESIPARVKEPVNREIIFRDVASLADSKSLLMNNAKPPHGPSLSSEYKEPQLLYFPDNTQLKGAQRWSIAAMASPAYYSNYSTVNSDVTKQLMASEQPMNSYTGGVSFAYKMNKRLSIQSGLYYSSLSQSIDGISSYGGFQRFDYAKGDNNFEVITSRGTISTKNADVFLSASSNGQRLLTYYTKDVFDPVKANLQYINNTLRQNFSYLELPILLRYKVIDKAIDINLIGGVSYNMLVGNSVYTTIDGSKYSVGETEDLNTLTVSSSLGMGMEYNLSEKFSLNIEPTVRYYLNPFSATTSTSTHPYSFGIFSGVSYKF